MLSLALVGIIWQLMYSPADGLIDSLMGLVAHNKDAGQPGAIDWLGDPNINIWSALIAATWKHVGYIMILYLAGLKGVDPSLKEAAAIDGANERQIFFRVVFPAMRPINIVVVVITIIESLRAFDIVWIFNHGTNGLELISALVIQNLIGEGQVIGVGSALAVILLVVSLVPIVMLPDPHVREGPSSNDRHPRRPLVRRTRRRPAASTTRSAAARAGPATARTSS